jgi:hypothetical protein
VNEVINTDQSGAARAKYSTASVANDEIADSCGTILFLKPTMAVAVKKPVKSSYPMTTKQLPLANR